MWLKNGDHSVLLSPQGGSILQWQWREHFILGPSRMVRIGEELELRGESHWCYPNFGTPPPEYGILGKHGPFRKTLLKPSFGETTQSCRFTGKQGCLHDDDLKVDYNLGLDGLLVTLSVCRNSSVRTPVLPAFHPYFPVPQSRYLDVTFNGRQIFNREFTRDAVVCERNNDVIGVHISDVAVITMEPSDDCTHVVLWSDNPSYYVCVEPIFGKPGTFGTSEGRWINPGEQVECSVRFDFRPIA